MGHYLSISLPIIGVILYYVQRYYLRTSRQVRLLCIETRAPIYGHFLDTIRGTSTIRAFGWETSWRKQYEKIFDESQRPFYMLLTIQQWLTLMMDLLVWVIAVALVTTAMLLRSSTSAGELGIALNIILTFDVTLTGTIQSWTKLETSIGAVTRTQSFIDDTLQESNRQDCITPSLNWPSEGQIMFESVTASYRYVSTFIKDPSGY